MKLIDADALKDGLCRECTFYGKEECLEAKGEECDWDSIGHINAAKTIDAVPVVRCKDCKYNDHAVCKKIWYYVTKNHFCSYGEREEGDSHERFD